jgi:hypothetical protein
MSALRIRLCAIPLVLCADVVDHVAEMIVRVFVVGVRVGEVIFWELEDDGNKDEELADDFLPAVAVEGGDFGVIFTGDFVEWFVGVGWDGFGDVELGIVRMWIGVEGV